jgi:DNA-binding LytR/AlgR family response regulator
MNLRCLIIDDEPIARKGMQEFIQEVPFLVVAGQCENATRAAVFLAANKIDLIFLDIQMPRISGIEFLKSLSNPPMAILTTANPDYALEGFALDVIDYLVKPVSLERFVKAANKARDLFELRQRPAGEEASYFFVKSNGNLEKVLFSELLYAEAYQNYCILHLPGRKLITYLTFTALEKQLSVSHFIRVHKSFIVSIPKIDRVDSHSLQIGNVEIPISRSLKEEVKKRIVGSKLLKRP